MGPADTLSDKDHLDTTDDNVDTPILPDPIVINTLNLTLSHCRSQRLPTFTEPFSFDF